jgi:hypothetical protein
VERGPSIGKEGEDSGELEMEVYSEGGREGFKVSRPEVSAS